uniref:Uncharacterized protein n=1 Tax=Anas platyrhynchos platyrhynchos TaxID=8840 RepID=A0A493TYT2_ANAPP
SSSHRQLRRQPLLSTGLQESVTAQLKAELTRGLQSTAWKPVCSPGFQVHEPGRNILRGSCTRGAGSLSLGRGVSAGGNPRNKLGTAPRPRYLSVQFCPFVFPPFGIAFPPECFHCVPVQRACPAVSSL